VTKDGRPSRITDIRYFYGSRATYLKPFEEATAYGRRMAWYLNGEDFCLGSYPQLYIYFTPDLAPGTVAVTEQGFEWWQRYINIGVPKDFATGSETDNLVALGTVAALQTIRPDLAQAVEHADAIVRSHCDSLRFLLRSRTTKRFIVEVSTTIGTWPAASQMFVSLTDRSTGDYLESPPEPFQIYLEAPTLAASVRVDMKQAVVSPSNSLIGGLISARHGGAIAKPLSDFTPSRRPPISKLVKLR
jgi:hypothetical protein